MRETFVGVMSMLLLALFMLTLVLSAAPKAPEGTAPLSALLAEASRVLRLAQRHANHREVTSL